MISSAFTASFALSAPGLAADSAVLFEVTGCFCLRSSTSDITVPSKIQAIAHAAMTSSTLSFFFCCSCCFFFFDAIFRSSVRSHGYASEWHYTTERHFTSFFFRRIFVTIHGLTAWQMTHSVRHRAHNERTASAPAYISREQQHLVSCFNQTAFRTFP